jgi:hypothetical protein
VDPSDDLPPRPRPLLLPVVLATVFLTIIGMSAGIALGARHNLRVRDAQDRPAPASVATTPSGQPCRPETQRVAWRFGAQGTLRVQLLLHTRTSAVWICQDDAGRLYYHANRGGEDARWIENETALFMADVQRDGDGYTVTASDGTTFSVTSQRLRILHKDGREEIQRAAG